MGPFLFFVKSVRTIDEMVSWEAKVPWRGAEVTITCYENDSPISTADLPPSGGCVLALLEREETARREVAMAMLDLAEDWRAARDDEESGTPLTLEKFMGLMHLEAIVIEDGGGLTVYYDDGEEVFAGHAIQARFDSQGILTDTDIPG